MLYALLAVFAACTGYAAGRLHQWYRMDADREEAYREGYDEAARSTFTMAARMAGRDKSAVRASASVQPASPPGPSASGPPASAPGRSSPAAKASSPGPSSAAGGSSSSAAGGGGSAEGGGHAGRSAAPNGSDEADAAVRPAGLGTPFPVPESPVLPPVARSGAGGFRPSGFAGLVPPTADAEGADEAVAEPRPAGRRSKPGRATGRLPRRGRHLVPQELVRAATYRLSPDRVARAKVPGALPPPGEEAGNPPGADPEPPAPPAVPKPRSS